ncbi:MAG: c-type cytochrome [Alphaproteobacteria bacterium]
MKSGHVMGSALVGALALALAAGAAAQSPPYDGWYGGSPYGAGPYGVGPYGGAPAEWDYYDRNYGPGWGPGPEGPDGPPYGPPPGYYPFSDGGAWRPGPPQGALPMRMRDRPEGGPGPGPCRDSGNGSGSSDASQAGQPARKGAGPGGGMVRHFQVVRWGLPEQYRAMENPYAPTTAAMTEATRLYAENCATCHGESGVGDGSGAAALTPRPANLRMAARSPIASDGYLFWTITEGGEQLGTGMRAFKGKLTDEQIWKVILYLRAGLPRNRPTGG